MFSFPPALQLTAFQHADGIYVPCNQSVVGPFTRENDVTGWEKRLQKLSGTQSLRSLLRSSGITRRARIWLRTRYGPEEAIIRPTAKSDGVWALCDIQATEPELTRQAALPPSTLVQELDEPSLQNGPIVHDTAYLDDEPCPVPFVDAPQRAVVVDKRGLDGGVVWVLDSLRMDTGFDMDLSGRFIIAAGPDRRRLSHLTIVSAHDEPEAVKWAVHRCVRDPNLGQFAEMEKTRLRRPRDTQRPSVYAWEDALWDTYPKTFRQRLSLEQAQDIVHSLWQQLGFGDAPNVSIDNRLRVRSYSSSRHGIVLQRNHGLQLGTVLHELAHELVRARCGTSGLQAHGAEFMGMVCGLYSHVSDLDPDVFCRSARAADLKIDEDWTYSIGETLEAGTLNAHLTA